MRHGDEIQILVGGPSIRSKSLEPLGISDKSQCWGTWIDRRVREGEPHADSASLDFVISPIHPSLWPFVFRIEASLNPQVGTLKSLCQQLLNNGTNILYLDQSPGGYSHSVFNAICTFGDAKGQDMFETFAAMERKVAEIRAKSAKELQIIEEMQRESLINAVREAQFRDLGRQMMARLVGLWCSLRIEEQNQYDEHIQKIPHSARKHPDVFFLASRVVEQGLEPWFTHVLDPDGQLLDIEHQPDDDGGTKQEVDQCVADADLMMQAILNAAFPPGENHRERATIDKLLDDLLVSHKATRYGPENKGPLTVQAKLARMSPASWKRHIIRRIAWRHAHLPLTVHALIRLAQMRFWMAPYEPIEFHYDADRHQLCPTSPERFREQVNALGRCGPLRLDRPVWALATFHHEDRCVRLRFLPERTADSRVRIEIAYKVPGKIEPDPSFGGLNHKPARTRGLIAKVADSICQAGGNVLRVTNSIGTFDPNTGIEVGKIRFTVEFKSQALSDPFQKYLHDAVKRAVDTVIDNPNDDAAQVPPADAEADDLGATSKGSFRTRSSSRIHIIPFKRERIFVSTIFSHCRFQDFRRILDKVAARYGLETVYAKNNTVEVRRNVHQQIAECRYFLQIVTPRSEDQIRMRNDFSFIPDFTWVTYEHGCAMALRRDDARRRCVQMIDQLLPELARARLDRTRGDIPPIDFRLDDDQKTLRRRFGSAVVELLRDP